MSHINPELPFLFLTLGLCAFFVWLVSYRLGTLIPEPGLRLATLFLSIQILLIAINIIMAWTGTDIFPVYLWHLDKEFSIPSINSTIQLFLLCSLCLLTGFASGRIFLLERVYWLILGIGIAGMSLVEFDVFPRTYFPKPFILPSGIFMTVGAIVIVLLKSNHNRLSLLLLLPGGLWIWAYAAFVVDKMPPDIFINFGPLEETLETLGVIIALAGVAGYATESLRQTRTWRKRLLTSLCLTNVVAVVLLCGALAIEDNVEWQIRFLNYKFGHKITVDIDDGALALRGWTHDHPRAGHSSAFNFWLYATRPLKDDFGFTVQLLDQESRAVVLGKNKRSDTAARQWHPGVRYSSIQKVRLFLPESVPTNRALWLTLSFWKTDETGYSPLPVGSSDFPLLGDTHVILDELLLPQPVDSIGQMNARGRFANGFVLYDASIPEQAQAGEALDVTFHWGTDSPSNEDLIQFLHFFHEESGEYWVVDQMPLGLRLPTRLWYEGLRSSEVWQFTLPADLQPGRYSIYSGLYRLSDMQRLGVTLADGTQPVDARIPLGTILIEG